MLVIYPGSALIFLSSYPDKLWGQLAHNAKWILLYVAVEWFALRLGYITNNSNWNLWWSLAVDSLMFPMMRYHSRRPSPALGVTVIIIVAFIALFPP
ncbi:hypothetical protein FHS18_005542 [Paenibacillus phyllosphaerae]|uniref:Uncharacterized protein n=1 Tax=Paenibacillus phyllosphaerae TaxID=274593 RepID=A0A7W5B2W3_9BACL|nr:hypothetical protein [Paenibacillus phyllosphaerae]MBB3113430.1 hypothetical protein [Paenibacillus phyllosphaerae]